jgi:hypothetical protein
VAIKVPEVLLIQVKAADLDTDQHSRAWWNDLWDAAAACGATPIVADWPPALRGGGQRLRLRRLTAPRAPRSRTWPWAEYVTDEAAAAPRDGVLARLRAQNAELRDRLNWASSHPAKPYPGYPARVDLTA